MKLISLNAALLTAALLFAPAQPASAADDTTCESLAEFAETIMTARQRGLTLSSALELLNDAKFERIRDLLRTIVIQAYEAPLWSTEENKTKAIGEFRNEVHLACLRSGQ